VGASRDADGADTRFLGTLVPPVVYIHIYIYIYIYIYHQSDCHGYNGSEYDNDDDDTNGCRYDRPNTTHLLQPEPVHR
jgi:hypothetical protein